MPIPGGIGERRIEIAEILCQSDRSARHFEGTAEQELPDENELEESAGSRIAVHGVIEMIGSARTRKRRGQLAPDHSVGDGDGCTQHPADHRLGPVHRIDEEGNRDERTDPNHQRHIQANGLEQAKPTL